MSFKSKRKGNAGERYVVNILNERFKTTLEKHKGSFSRVVGSGNRRYQTKLSKSDTKFFSGDINFSCDSLEFKFIIEVKFGYDTDMCLS